MQKQKNSCFGTLVTTRVLLKYSLMESILNLPQAEHFIRSAAENHACISGQEKGGD